MKKTMVTLLVLGVLFAFTGSTWAAEKKKKETVAVTPRISEQEIKAIETRALTTLDSQQWTIYLSDLGVRKAGRLETDILTFTGSSMSSGDLTAKGFSNANFNLRVREDGIAVIETVMRHPDGGIAMWRAELNNNNLYGTLSVHHKNGQIISNSFTSAAPAAEVAPVKVETKKK